MYSVYQLLGINNCLVPSLLENTSVAYYIQYYIIFVCNSKDKTLSSYIPKTNYNLWTIWTIITDCPIIQI
mgnify:CR=1 FL=1